MAFRVRSHQRSLQAGSRTRRFAERGKWPICAASQAAGHIARFLAFRPDAERALPARKLRLLRVLTSKRGQLFEAREQLLAQINAHQNQGVDEPFQEMDALLRLFLDNQVAELESQTECLIATDTALAETAGILRLSLL